MISAILLAGGKSRRMGQNKATLPFRGTHLGLYVARKLQEFSNDVLVVTAHPGWFPGFRTVGDRFPGCGPLEGLATGLEAIRHDWAFLVACDMPNLDEKLIRQLLSQPTDHLAIVPVTPEGLQPLGALYHRRLLSAVRTALLNGERSLQAFIGQISYAPVQMDDDRTFLNLNRPQEYEQALASGQFDE